MQKFWPFYMLVGLALNACLQCRDLNCDNGGFCQEGECLCEKWYSGEKCQLLYNRNFEGIYQGNIDSVSRSVSGLLNIEADRSIPNRLNVLDGVYMEFENDTQLIIPTQVMMFGLDTVAVTGEGTYLDEVLSFRYKEEFVERRGYLFEFTGRRIESLE